MEGGDVRRSHLSRLAPVLSEPLLRYSIQAANGLRDSEARAQALGTLLARLAELGFADEALAFVDTIPDEFARAHAGSQLAPHLSEQLRIRVLERALEAARRIWDGGLRQARLRALAPELARLPR